MRGFIVAGLLLAVLGCGPRSTDAWLGQLKDAEVVKRRQAIRELGAHPADARGIVPALLEALHDTNGYVRRDAAVTLGTFGPQAGQAVEALVAALQDSDRRVRKAAGAALKKIDARAAEQAGVK